MSRLIDWKNVCLVCLKKGENRSIFERDNNSNLIADIIIKCADIFIEKDTNQPKSICLQCLDNLNVTYKFHRNYEQSDSIIKALLSTNHQEFQIKDLWKTTPFRGAQQKESPQNEILHIEEILDVEESANSDEIKIKHEIIENDIVDDTHDNDNPPSIDLGDNIDTEAKFVLKDPVESCFQGSAIKLNDVETNKSNKICEICNRAFTCLANLNIHIRRHNNERPFNCNYCDKAYVTSGDLGRHMKVHTGEQLYGCQYCDRSFTQKSHRKSHERMHTGERPFVCPTCGKSFAYSHVLSNHRRIHTGVKKFMSEEFDNGFNRKELVETHVRHHLSEDKLDKSSEHKQRNMLKKVPKLVEFNLNEINSDQINDLADVICVNENSPCHDLEDEPINQSKSVVEDRTKVCFPSTVNELSNVKANERNTTKQEANNQTSSRLRGQSKALTGVSCVRPSPNSGYKRPIKTCEICNRSCRSQHDLDIHMKRHYDERPFSCDHCDKAFVTYGDLRRHMKVHTGEKPYECQYCDRRFTENRTREKHERIHTGEKPYECQYCNRRFAVMCTRKTHERTHTGEKPYECQYCDRRFTQNRSRTNHERTHTGEKPYECQYCDCRFAVISTRKTHERTHTGEKPYECQYCDRRFTENRNRKIHERMHTRNSNANNATKGLTERNLSKGMYEIFQIEECAKSNETNIKHEVKLIEDEIN